MLVSIQLTGLPSNIHLVFHTDLLWPASQDPLLGQETDNNQPAPVLFKLHDEWQVEEILCARNKRRGKGREALVKWTGYHTPTWEPVENMQDTVALDEYKARYSEISSHNGPKEKWEKSVPQQK